MRGRAGLRILAALAALLVVVGLLAACTSGEYYTARFLRYKALPDGKRVAVVTPVGNAPSEQQTAFTDISDLEPDELVRVHVTGRSWDSPQWTPEREIVSRASSSTP